MIDTPSTISNEKLDELGLIVKTVDKVNN